MAHCGLEKVINSIDDFLLGEERRKIEDRDLWGMGEFSIERNWKV